MFIISLPISTKIGDTVDVKINGEPARVCWRDDKTLTIEPHDHRAIYSTITDGDLTRFICGNGKDEPQSGPTTIFVR
jgi:hypothetical protein